MRLFDLSAVFATDHFAFIVHEYSFEHFCIADWAVIMHFGSAIHTAVTQLAGISLTN
jgi:hypothetical protein